LNAIIENSGVRLNGQVFAWSLSPSGVFLAVMIFF